MFKTATMRPFLIAAWLSLFASACLAAIPTIWANFPFGWLIVVNWIFFMIMNLGFKRSNVEELSYHQSKLWERMQAVTLLAFTGAGFVAVATGNPLAMW